MNLLDCTDLIIGHTKFFDHNLIILDTWADRILDRLRLLVDLLHHEVLVAALLRVLLCRIDIPIDMLRLLLDCLSIDIEEFNLIFRQTGNLAIFNEINISCVL